MAHADPAEDRGITDFFEDETHHYLDKQCNLRENNPMFHFHSSQITLLVLEVFQKSLSLCNKPQEVFLHATSQPQLFSFFFFFGQFADICFPFIFFWCFNIPNSLPFRDEVGHFVQLLLNKRSLQCYNSILFEISYI